MQEVWYDLDPNAAELWVVAGPPGWQVGDINPDSLPEGFRWVEEDEWAEYQQNPESRPGLKLVG